MGATAWLGGCGVLGGGVPALRSRFWVGTVLLLVSVSCLSEVLRHFGRDEEALDRSISRGALYSSLARLEQKEFLAWSVEAASSSRGGNRNRMFEVTEQGLETLRQARAAVDVLSEGLESKLEKVNR